MEELLTLRQKIDDIDGQILKLLNDRGKIALEIGEIKKRNQLQIHAPERERDLLRRLVQLNQGPLPEGAIRAIFREIMSASLSLEQTIKVSYMGPQASFSHLAAMKLFGSSFDYLSQHSIKDVFESVAKERATYGVVPIENSTEGAVNYTLDMFACYDLFINSEFLLDITNNLLSLTGNIEDIQKVYSHPQPLGQCRNYIETHLKGALILESPSTAKAAEYASQDKTIAAIASELAAKIYNLQFIDKKIDDSHDNYTRFLVIAKDYPSRSGNDKTSILFSLQDKVGALYEALRHFKRHHINLTKIQSRPSKIKAWEYIFFIDLAGHIEDEPVKTALEEVKKDCMFFKVLGSYAAAKR